MPLTLVTGRANSGKTRAVYKALASPRIHSATLLLPTGPDVERARRDLSSIRPVGIEVAQFDRYLEGRWSLLGDARGLADETLRLDLCHQAARACKLESAGTPGFPAVLATVVRHLADRDALPREAQGDPVLEAAAEYARLLDYAGLVEPGEACALLGWLERLPDGTDLVVAHRFTELTRAQEAHLLACSAAGVEVMVTLVWEQGLPATAAVDELASRLLNAAQAHHVATAPVRDTGAAELADLEESLFDVTRRLEPRGTVGLIEAHGEEAEADGVAEQALEWLQAGMSGEEIAIVYRDPLKHAPFIARAMSQAGVPFDLDVRVPVYSTPLGRAIRALLAFAGGLELVDLAAFLRSPFSGEDATAVDRLDADLRGRGVRRGHGVRAAVASLGAPARDIVSEAIRLANRPLDDESARMWVRLLGRMLRSAHGDASPLLSGDGWSDASSQRAICQAVCRLATVPCGELSGVRIHRALELTRSQPIALERPGRVQVMSVERVRSRRFRAVVLGGLTADEFPRARGRSDDEVAANTLGREEVRDHGVADLDRERLLFYLVVSRARERLVLSRRVSDGAGRPLRPSPFWEEILDAYRPPEEGSIPRSSGLRTRRVVPFEELRPTGLEQVHGRKAARALAAGWCKGHPGEADVRERASCLALRRTGLSEDALEQLAGRDTIRASELEAYVACPFRWFYERSLAPRGIDAEFGPLEMGTLAHETLRTVYELLPERLGVRRLSPGTLDAALALAKEALSLAMAAFPRPETLEEVDVVRTVTARVTTLLRADAGSFLGFEPVELEWAFGPRATATGLRVAGVDVCGRVDRIDCDSQALVVMDYKSGKTVGHRRFESDGLIQIPLYAQAARSVFGRPVVGGLYRSLSDGGNRGFVLKNAVIAPGKAAGGSLVCADELESIIASGLQRAEAAVQGIRAGRVQADPVSDSVCTYCAAADLCGRGV